MYEHRELGPSLLTNLSQEIGVNLRCENTVRDRKGLQVTGVGSKAANNSNEEVHSKRMYHHTSRKKRGVGTRNDLWSL
jgi:hypothetical protein